MIVTDHALPHRTSRRARPGAVHGGARRADARPLIFDCREVNVFRRQAGRARRDPVPAPNEITALIGPSGCGKSTVPSLPEPDARGDPWCARRGPRLARREPLRQSDRSGPGPQAHRDGVPEAQPVPEVDLRQRRLRPARDRHEGRYGRDRRERAEARRAVGRGQGPAQDERLRHVRRPAAAALHRARARHRARRAADGRAVLRAGPDLDGPDRGSDGRAQAATTRS